MRKILSCLLLSVMVLVPLHVAAEETDSPTPHVDKIPVYRAYNPFSGEHLFTVSTAEYEKVGNAGWTKEGIAFQVPVKSESPVYRLYNPNGSTTDGVIVGDHHYTTSAVEKDYLISAGWIYEGIVFYSCDEHEVKNYRLYNPNANAGAHHYTVSEGEVAYLVSVGWRDEGVGFYSCK